MSIREHLTTFAGLPVRQFDPQRKRGRGGPCVWRVGGTRYVKSACNDAEHTFGELLGLFLDAHGERLESLVVGAWDYEQMCRSLGKNGAAEVVEALLDNRKRLAGLRHLFLGDVTSEECEISWINPGDLSALLPALPRLEELRVRGGNNLTFGKLSHKNLKTLALESGGLPATVIDEVCQAKLPALERLELWLGSPDYGGIENPGPLAPLLKTRSFRKLRYLGLCNSEIADALACAVSEAPLLERLEVLDLSRGNMTDVGAEALLRSTAVRKLKKLDLHHHFISKPFAEQLRKLPLEVDVSEAQQPHFYEARGAVHTLRFIVAAE